jgi:hypothetical protein
MNLTRCENGHFYDKDKFKECPHCGPQDRNADETVSVDRDDSVTMAVTQPGISEQKTTKFSGSTSSSLSDAVQQATKGASGASDEDATTIGYYGKAIGTEPVVGWLVCIEGNHLGEDFRLKSGRNFIGRSSGMDVAITGDSSVARDRHAVVVYDPKSVTFLVQAGDAKELCYLNGSVVLSAEKLESNDVLTMGGTQLMFFPCCSEKFNWDQLAINEAGEDKKKD